MRCPLDTRVVSIAGLLMLLAACSSDSVVAPKHRRTAPPGAPRAEVIMNSVADDSMSADFTVTPEGGTFKLGKHAVIFPANAICDPATSSYGPGTWDEPCTAVDTAVSFHAEIRGDSTGAIIAFTPSVRFVPTDNPEQYAWIMMSNPAVATAEDPSQFAILWVMDDGTMVDEAKDDPTLATYLYTDQGIVYRRIKHFSAYNAWGYLEEITDALPPG
jgi:hypothetical protein